MRRLLMKIDPNNAPKVQLAAWNVGPRKSLAVDCSSSAFGIQDLLSADQMVTLASVYFDKVDPCYGFLERDSIFQQISNRWRLPSSFETCDGVLCGVAALGSYFSQAFAVPVEAQLVRLAKSVLESTSPTTAPEPDIVTAWVCHTIYLRLTSTPLAAWIASCTTMHMLEAAGLHRDACSEETVLTRPRLSPSLRRAFGVAQHLNTWISYDLGLSRVDLRSPEITPGPFANGNYTNKLLELLPISLGLDRIANQQDEYLQSTLTALLAKIDVEPPLIMAQCNLILCILRQLCARSSLRPDDHHSALYFLDKGLGAARQMIKDDCPWHHLANVPFQTLCVLLAIDTPASLRMVGDAMQTLQSVAAAYPTDTLHDAYNTACLVLWMHQQRRLNDAKIIDGILSRLAGTGEMALDSGYDNPADVWATPTEEEVAWIDALISEFPSLHNFGAENILNEGPSHFLGLNS